MSSIQILSCSRNRTDLFGGMLFPYYEGFVLAARERCTQNYLNRSSELNKLCWNPIEIGIKQWLLPRLCLSQDEDMFLDPKYLSMTLWMTVIDATGDDWLKWLSPYFGLKISLSTWNTRACTERIPAHVEVIKPDDEPVSDHQKLLLWSRAST